MENPYAENNMHFELDETPVTVLDWRNARMDSYQPKQHSKSFFITRKYGAQAKSKSQASVYEAMSYAPSNNTISYNQTTLSTVPVDRSWHLESQNNNI